MSTDKGERKAADKSPENDITKAIDHLRSARAKYIRGGDETKGGYCLEVIGRAELILGKTGA